MKSGGGARRSFFIASSDSGDAVDAAAAASADDYLVVSEQYTKCGFVAEHEPILHPVGTLFRINRDYAAHSFANVGEGTLQMNKTDNGNHTVSIGYGGHSSEEKVSFSSSHLLSSSNHLELQCTSDLHQDAYCSLSAWHQFDEKSLLCSRYREGLTSDPVVEMEVRHERQCFQANGNFERNMSNGSQHCVIESKILLPADTIVKSSLSTDMRGDGCVGVELLSTSALHTISLRTCHGRSGTKELFVKGSRSLGKGMLAEASAYTNFDLLKNISLEGKCKVFDENEASVKLSSSSSGIHEITIKTSHLSERDSWKCKYSKRTGDGHLLGLEWEKRDLFNNLFMLSVELSGDGIAFNGKFNHDFAQ